MQRFKWAPFSSGVFISEAGPCRLTVAIIGGSSRFLVHRQVPRAAGDALPLVASGTRHSLSAAMAAAEATANRIAVVDLPADAAR